MFFSSSFSLSWSSFAFPGETKALRVGHSTKDHLRRRCRRRRRRHELQIGVRVRLRVQVFLTEHAQWVRRLNFS